MEVGQERVDHEELGARRQEQLGRSGATARPGGRLQGPDGRGPDGDHPLRRLAGGERLGRDVVALAVHDVVLDVLGRDRAERAQPDDEIHGRHLRTRGADAVEHGRREVQASGRRRDRTGSVGVDRLVALRVLQHGLDVGRERDLTVSVERGQQVAAVHLDGAATVVETLAHHHGQVVADLERRAGSDLPRGPHQRLPGPVVAFFEQEDLDGTARGLAQVQPGREHPGRVQDHDVAGSDQLRQVADDAVLRVLGRATIDQQAGPVTGLDGVLGDGLRWELVVEGRGLHGAHRSYRESGKGTNGAVSKKTSDLAGNRQGDGSNSGATGRRRRSGARP